MVKPFRRYFNGKIYTLKRNTDSTTKARNICKKLRGLGYSCRVKKYSARSFDIFVRRK